MTASADSPGRPRTVPELLHSATDRSGHTPEQWLATALAGAEGPVLDLRAAAADRVTLRLLEPTGPGRIEAGRAEADRLPVRTNGLAGLRATMCLPVLEPLGGLFAELRRVLRPTGTVAALVPSRPGSLVLAPRGWLPLNRALNRALGGHPGFRNESARDHLSWLFTAADFAVLTDQRRVFWLPIPDRAAAEAAIAALVPAGVWPPEVPADRVRRASEELAQLAAPGRRLPIALRMLVGRR